MKKQLMRSGRDKKIAGVCAGGGPLSRYGSNYRSRNMGCPCLLLRSGNCSLYYFMDDRTCSN